MPFCPLVMANYCADCYLASVKAGIIQIASMYKNMMRVKNYEQDYFLLKQIPSNEIPDLIRTYNEIYSEIYLPSN